MEEGRLNKVLFLLKNGIGFGHFKRALIIADALKDRGVEVIFISQAKSYDIFKNRGFKVFNFPMVEQAATNNEQLIFYELLNFLIDKINPDVVIEDTYPDEYYLSLPSVRYRSKLLILRRLNSQGIFNYIKTGLFSEYSKIIVLQSKEDFILKQKYDLNKLCLNSDKFEFAGDVFDKISNINLKSRKKYCEEDEKLVVINCGAGGLQIGEDFVLKLFHRVINVIPELQIKMKNKIKFIIVSGPYTNFNLDNDYMKKNNVEIYRYLSSLSELFSISDLNIIRPGYNSTMESISGYAHTILIPSISFMEDQLEWCNELKCKYNVDYLTTEDDDSLIRCILKNLNEKKEKFDIHNYVYEVADKICSFKEKHISSKKEICLCGNYKMQNIVDLNEVKCNTQLIETEEQIDIKDINLTIIGNEQFGLNKNKLEYYYSGAILDKNIVEFYKLYSSSRENIIMEIGKLINNGFDAFCLPDGLSYEDLNFIIQNLVVEYKLIDLNTYLVNNLRKTWQKYKWQPWEPYYKDLK